MVSSRHFRASVLCCVGNYSEGWDRIVPPPFLIFANHSIFVNMLSKVLVAEKLMNGHLHLTGSLTLPELKDIARRHRINLRPFEPIEQEGTFHDSKMWAVAKEVTSQPAGLLSAILKVLENEKTNGVAYIELTLNPFGMVRRGLKPKYIASILEESVRFAESRNIFLRFKLGVNRKDDPSSVMIVREVYLLSKCGVCSHIDLNGDERRYPIQPFITSFASLTREGIPVSLHVGEYNTHKPTLDEILVCKPSRIAHALHFDRSDYAVLAEQKIAIEVSLISNRVTGALGSTRTHPVREMADCGIQVIIGTDDPAFFGKSTITDELVELSRHGFSTEEILDINRSACLSN